MKYLKEKCRKALNILRVVGHTDWGADKSTLLKLYRTLVRSKLDYGCAVYGSTKHYILKSLDPIHHQGLRIALGAFRTSPVQSLYAEAGEPSLRHRRLKLSMTYFLKLKSLPDNPCHNVINNPPPSELFERTKTIAPFGTRTLPHIEEANIEPNSIDSQYERWTGLVKYLQSINQSNHESPDNPGATGGLGMSRPCTGHRRPMHTSPFL